MTGEGDSIQLDEEGLQSQANSKPYLCSSSLPYVDALDQCLRVTFQFTQLHMKNRPPVDMKSAQHDYVKYLTRAATQ